MSVLFTNYEVVGSPTINANYILSDVSEHNYVKMPEAITSLEDYTVLMKVNITADSSLTYILLSDQGYRASIWLSGSYSLRHFKLALDDSEGSYVAYDISDLTVETLKSYWLKFTVSDQATNKVTLSAIEDNGYTKDTLPSTGWHTTGPQSIIVSGGLFSNVCYNFGRDLSAMTVPLSIDLKGCTLRTSTLSLWDAVQNLQPLDKGYTNYTVIGSPTYSSGVYSDFGMYDYLVLPQELKSDSRVYILKFTTGADITTRQFVLNADKLFDIEVYQGNICTTDWSGNMGSRTVLFSATANTAYYFKVVVDGTQKTFSHSTDGSTWTQDDQFTDTGLVPGRTVEDFTVGRGAWLSYPFLGSVDFNDFFVLGSLSQTVLWSPSTKAEEVVTDYTTSGSITVADHIASGFSSSSWVYKDISQSSVTDFEFIIKVNQSSYASHSDVVNSRTADKPVGFDSSGHLGIFNGSDWQYGSTVYSTGVDTWVMLKYSEGSYKVYGLIDNNYTIDSLPALSSWNLETTWTTSLSTYLDSYLDLGANRTATQEYFRGTVDLTGTCVRINGTEVWRAVSFISAYNYGNVSISKGYYNDGSHTILMPAQTLDLPTLKYGQITGNRNKVYAASYNGTASVHLVGDDATAQTLRGTYDVSVDVEQPVYLSHAENYAVSGDAGDISQVEFSYNPGGVSEDYTVVGSPTIDEDYVASGFSSTSYVTSPTTFNPDSSAWEVLVKVKTGSSVSSEINIIGYASDEQGFRIGLAGSSVGKWQILVARDGRWINTSSHYGSYSVQTDTVYWLKAGFTGSRYYLEYSLDGETFTQDVSYNSSYAMTIPSNPEMRIGAGHGTSWNGSIYLTDLQVTIGDAVWWRAAQNEQASVTIPKTFWYDTTGKDSYWYPEAVTAAIDTVSSEQTLGDVNSVFVTNELGQDVSGITFTNGTVQGKYVSSAKAPGQNVYLDHKTNEKILGVQGAPDEIVVASGGGTPTTDYSVSGSPTIDSNYVVSNFGSSRYVYKDFDISSPTEFEIVTKVVFDNVNTHAIFCHSGGKSPVAIDTSGRLEEWNGSSYTTGSTTYSMNQALWIKLRYSSGQNTVYGLVDNGYTISTLPPTSSWNQEFSISSDPDFLSGRLVFGVNVDNSAEYLQGSLYLEDTYVSVDGSIIWKAVSSGGGSTITNYTVVGSPTINLDYVASDFSSRNGVAATETLDTSNAWKMFVKVKTGSNTSTRQKFIGCANSADQKIPTLEIRNSNIWVCIPNSGGTGWLQETSTGFSPSASTDYWFEYGWDGSEYYLKLSTDGVNYTKQWYYTSSTAAYHSSSYQVLLGNDLYSSYEQIPFLGEMDLKECYFEVNGTEVWRAVDFSDPTEVTIGTTDNWTALQNRTYWYEEGNTTDVSDLTTDTYEADLKGYIIFTEDLNQDPVVKALTSAYEVTAYNTSEVYSGYSYTVTDSTGTTLDTFEKTGTFCKGFKHPAIAGTHFVFIPVEDIEDGKTYEEGDLRDYYSETNGTPFRQLDESSEDYTYDAATDTLTSENDVTFESIGYVYVEWNDIAE